MVEVSSIRQFLILLYKGSLLRKRHYIVTFFEIVIPVFIACIFPIIMSSQYTPRREEYIRQREGWEDNKIYPPESPYTYQFTSYIQFVYTPSNNMTDQFVADAIEKFQNNTYFGRYNDDPRWQYITTHATTSERELEVYCRYSQNSGKKMIGTVFYGFDSKEDKLPSSLNYKIRYSTKPWESFYTNLKYRVSGPSYETEYSDSYFLGWQTAVEETFIDRKMEQSGNKFDYQVYMQRFPYPAHRKSEGIADIISMTPMLIGYGYLIFMLNILRRIIEEKSNGSKELMKMMGMTDTVYWMSTFVNYFIVGLVTIAIITIVYTAPLSYGYQYIKYTNSFLLFLMLLLLITSVVLFCMAFSIFFNRAVFAVIAFIILWNLSYNLLMTNYFIKDSSDLFSLSVLAKFGMCLIPTGSMQMMFRMISFYESSQEGVQWTNLKEFALLPDYNMLMVLLTMLFSCLLYVIIIWYFDKVWPWQPGVPLPFYFMFTKSYWCGSTPSKGEESGIPKEQNFEYFEEEPSGTRPGVAIQNLSKKFKVGLQTKFAVNNISLNIFQGQITALLGHNGAGKTTTINILTGLYSPSSGTASINGIDILRDTLSARKGLGVCPQHNVLFDTLTVDEHLKIFAGLKGVNWKDLNNEALKVLDILKLTDKRYELVKNLSGGMKRKLSLGNAIVGGSKVLFLDEPTSGMDVEARRSVWDALLGIRNGRTIILTTHYMEEADILGDRIAIMAEGEIQCCGSPMFLKRKFGTGYHLHMVKSPSFNMDGTLSLLRKHIPEITVQKELENEITFSLSSNSGSAFADMFEELEKHKEKLGINSCGITITTMEDVFLNVSNLSDVKYMKKPERSLQNGVSMDFDNAYWSSRETKQRNFANQFFAFLEKRFHYTKRHWSVLITQLALPFLLICMLFNSISAINKEDSSEALALDIRSVYGDTEGFYYKTDAYKYTDITEMTKSIQQVLAENGIKTSNQKIPTHYILDYGKNDLKNYLKTLLVGASIDMFSNKTMNLTAWYNGEPYHTMPMSLLMLHTAILRYVTKEKSSISLTNAPLPVFNMNFRLQTGFIESIFAGIFIPLALGFMSATAVLVPLHERATKAQLLQLMTGVPHVLYWIATLFWDLILCIVVSLILMIPFAIFYKYVFFGSHPNAIGTVLLFIWLYGFSSFPLSYLISFLFKKGNTGFVVVIAITCILGIAAQSTLSAVYEATTGKTRTVIDVFIWILRLFPPFALASGSSNLFQIAYNNAYCDSISTDDLYYNCNSTAMGHGNALFKCCYGICGNFCLTEKAFLQWDRTACGRDITLLIVDGIIFFSVLIMLQTSYFQSLFRLLRSQYMKLKKSISPIIDQSVIEDNDVLAEEQRVHDLFYTHTNTNVEALVILDLTKKFRNFYAVDRLSLGIHPEECFGLLGVNGAGKTTTFRMLTGDCFPDSGNALTTECSLIANTKKFQSYLGYCPQFDALIDRLTGRETLTLFARLRGLSGLELREKVQKLIGFIDLSEHADKQTQFYSGGNKRKLSVGIALIGSPSLILLDEPTAGVDPVSRRKIWNILAQARNHAKAAIILTTHSMEESEALCSRLAIMVNGRFRCLGPIQHLKSKFGQGYTLIIKMRKETADDPQKVNTIKTFIGKTLPSAGLKDDHQGMLQYHITDPRVRLSQLFKIMEDMKRDYNLEDYLISDTSLEQIFLTFARSQRVVAEN